MNDKSQKIYNLAKEAGLIEFEPLSWNPDAQSPTPDLLAALRDMLAEADKRITTSPLTRTKARAAISKATGENIANHYRDDL